MWEMTLCLCQYCSWYTFSLAMEIFSLILVKVLHISDIFLVKNGIPVFHVHLQFFPVLWRWRGQVWEFFGILQKQKCHLTYTWFIQSCFTFRWEPISICHLFHLPVCLFLFPSIHHTPYLRNHASCDYNFCYSCVK